MAERSSGRVCEIVLHLPNRLDPVWSLIAFDPNSCSMDLHTSKRSWTGADFPAQVLGLLREDDAELREQAAHAVEAGGAFFDKPLACAVQAEDRLLMLVLDRDEAHVGAADGFTDGSRVGGVVLAAPAGHAVRDDELGCHDADGVAVGLEQASPMVRTGTGFQADQARRELSHDGEQLVARDLGFGQGGLAGLINAMQCE